MTEQDIDERRVTWMPAFPAGGVALIVLAVFFPLGVVVAAAGLVLLVVRLVQRRWDVWGWVGLGAVVGAAVFCVLLLLHAEF